MPNLTFLLTIGVFVFAGCIFFHYRWKSCIRQKLLDSFSHLNQSFDGEIKARSPWLGQYPELIIRDGEILLSLRPTPSRLGLSGVREPSHTVITTVIEDPSFQIRCEIRTKGILAKLNNASDMDNLANDYSALMDDFSVEANNPSFTSEFLSSDIQQHFLDLKSVGLSFFIGTPFGPMTFICMNAEGIVTDPEKLKEMINIQLNCVRVLRNWGLRV